MRCLVIGVGAAAVLAGCGGRGETPAPEAVERAREVARRAADELAATLLPELQGALQSGGARAAVDVCAGKAQTLTAGVQERYAGEGVRIRRTSLQVRNAANAPDEFEREWLERATAAGGVPREAAEVREIDGGHELRYLRPLVMAELCVQCHGPLEGISPEVREILAERYPGDAATGFAVGELRGAISVRVGME